MKLKAIMQSELDQKSEDLTKTTKKFKQVRDVYIVNFKSDE